MHILLIEDDLDLGRALQSALKVEGLTCEWLRRVVDAPHQLDAALVDCVLLDLTLPDGHGFALLQRWRQNGGAVPVIVVTARAALDDRLAALDGGADDFVLKPFVMAELMSRIHAVLRRSARQASAVWSVGNLRLEPRQRAAWQGSTRLELSPREFQLLLELAREAGRVVVKSVLAQRLDPLGDPVEMAVIEVHLSNLRRKIGAGLIHTVRGVGYMLVAA